MKKRLLFVAILAIGSFDLFAQCTPGANYADSTFGAWPDTVQNFPHAMVDVAYVTDLNFKVPSDAGDIDPAYSGATINYFTVDNVSGLPAGMSYACNIASCTYNGGANGCAQISGTSSTVGTNDIVIQITANISIPFAGNMDVPYEFEGYKIIVDPALGVSLVKEDVVRVYPNPAYDVLTVEGVSNARSVRIVDLNGQVVSVSNVSGAKQEINVADLISGVYFVQIEGDNGTVLQKFVKK